jgi:hypothetical protein
MTQLEKQLRKLRTMRDAGLYGKIARTLDDWAEENTARGALFEGLLAELVGDTDSFDLALDEFLTEAK